MSHLWTSAKTAIRAKDAFNANISRAGNQKHDKKYKPAPEPEDDPEPAPNFPHVAPGEGQNSNYYNTSRWTPSPAVANTPGYHHYAGQQAWQPQNSGYGTPQPMSPPPTQGYDPSQQLTLSPQHSHGSPQPNSSSPQPYNGNPQQNYGSQGSPQQAYGLFAPVNENTNAYQSNQTQPYHNYASTLQYSPPSSPSLPPAPHITTPQRSITYGYSNPQYQQPQRRETVPIQVGPHDCEVHGLLILGRCTRCGYP